MKRLFERIDRDTANLILTILASQGVSAVPERAGAGGFDILVPETEIRTARLHVELYILENPQRGIPVAPVSPLPLFLNPAAVGAALLPAIVHILLIRAGTYQEALFRFGTSPYFIRRGDTFRAVTALFLHADFGHLLGNMAGLVILTGPLIRVTGPGTGLFMLLGAAVSGNLIANGLGQGTGISIGASTAVMAAAGLLTAHRSIRPPGSVKLPFWQPLAAGLTLMALFSQGPNTDISAHLFGFCAGVAEGLLLLPFFSVWHRSWMEGPALLCVLIILAASLIAGFA